MESSKLERLEKLKNETLLGNLDFATASPAGTAPVHTQKASSLLKSTREGPRLASGSASFDSLVVSSDADQTRGLSPGQLLELSGCPGEGKTRACLSYAVQTCLGIEPSDKALRVLIIDTQGCYSLNVLLRATQAACDGDEDATAACLERMAIWDCYESDDLLVALHALKGFLDANTSLKLVIIDSLSAPFNANLVPALSAQIVSDHEKSNKHRNGIGNSANKRQRKTYFTQDPKQEASYNITRTLMSGLLKDTLMAVTSRNVAVIVTTQSKTKLTDEFGERAGVRDAKHSFAVPQFYNHWHVPLSTQIILSAAGDGSRTAMTIATPSSIRGHNVFFRTTEAGIADA